MNRSDSPKKQPKPFGVNGRRVAILPTTPAGDNSASYEQGFPPITMILKSAGGLPPKGQDMNQILYELSALGRWSSTGALNTFDSEFASEISGYPSGAMLISNDGERIFINTTEGNLSDPNSNGAGWKDILSYLGLTNAIIGDTCKEAGFYLGSALAPYLMHKDTHTAIRLVTLDSVHRVTTSTYTINYYANGLIQILGVTPTVSSLSSPTLTFPVAFPTACIRFTLHSRESGIPSYNMAMYSNLSRTGAKIWGVANILGNSGSPTLGALPDAEISYEAWGY
ncbi:gp53-like domain-containing protein [Escherichia coli]